MADASIDDFLGVRPQAPWKRYIKWVAIAVGVVLLCLLLAKCFGAKEQTQYSTQAAERGNLTVTVSATGKLAPTNQVTVGSQLSGLVTKVVADHQREVLPGEGQCHREGLEGQDGPQDQRGLEAGTQQRQGHVPQPVPEAGPEDAGRLLIVLGNGLQPGNDDPEHQ